MDMKKFKKAQMLYIIFWAIIIISICPSINELYYYHYNNISVDEMIDELVDYTMVEPLNFNIKETLNGVPKELIKRLYDIGLTIDTTEDIGESSEYGKVTSKYIHRNKTIIIHRVYSNEVVLFHEIGHAISYNQLPFIKLSDTCRFIRLYENEKDLIFPNGKKVHYDNFNVKYEYIKVNPEEYFAQCFSMYVLGTLPEKTETYGFFEKYFKDMDIDMNIDRIYANNLK